LFMYIFFSLFLVFIPCNFMRFQMSNQIHRASLTSDDFLAPFKFAAIVVVIDIIKRRVRYVFRRSPILPFIMNSFQTQFVRNMCATLARRTTMSSKRHLCVFHIRTYIWVF
jgi:hypothetical protein